MFLTIKKILLLYNKIAGSKVFPFFNFFLKISEKFLRFLIRFESLPNNLKTLVSLNIYFSSRYNNSFVQYWEDRREFIELINKNFDSKNLSNEEAILKMEFFIEKVNFNQAKELFNGLKKSIYRDNYFDIFQNRNILYIGSAPTNYENIDFDDFDIIIANNFLDEKLHQHNIPLEKTVIFYNKGFAERNYDAIKKLRKNCKEVFFKDSTNIGNKKFVEASEFMFNDYGPMGAQNVLLAVVLGRAKSLTVYGVNGFLSQNPYDNNLKKYEISSQHISNILRRHELISNHNFLLLMSSLIQIKGGQEFMNLIDLTSNNYCKLIDKKYGKYKAKRIKGYGF